MNPILLVLALSLTACSSDKDAVVGDTIAPDDVDKSEDDTGSTGDDTSSAGDDTGSAGDDTGSAGDDTGSAGDDTGAPEPPPAGSGRIVAYFTEWGIYDRDYDVDDIPADKVTHINYAFADLTPAGECAVYDTWAALEREGGTYAKLRDLHITHPDLKVLISVGGWTLSDNFSSVAATASGRTAMVESCVNFMLTHGFDGIDIDWEYPVDGGLTTGTEADRENYSLLMAEFRVALDALGDGYLLTIAAPAGPTTIPYMDLEGLAPSLDWINVMTYDFHGGWESETNLHSSMYGASTSPHDESGHNVDAAIQTYLDAGVPADKVVLGMGFYGRGWSGVGPTGDGLYQPATGLAPGTWEAGVYDYWHILDLMTDPTWIYSVDDEALVPWIYNPAEGVFITFDDETSLGHKLDYIDANGLGGAMFWELSGDTDDHSLLTLLSTHFSD